MSKRHIIIGSSAAAMGVLSRLRRLAPQDEILCISASRELPFNTCLLADVLSGERPMEKVWTKPLSFFEENNIELHLGMRVNRIDAGHKALELSCGELLPYDTLFVGTGTSVFMPPIPGARAGENVFSFHTLSDTKKLLSFLKAHQPKRAIVIGAGLSGVECADSLAAHGVKVKLLERAPSVLPALVSSKGSLVIESHMSQSGVGFHGGTLVKEIVWENDRVCGVVLESGEKLPSDMLVFCTGGRPNTGLFEGTDVLMQAGGVVVDEHLKTSLPGVYAGGDVASVRHKISGDLVRNTLWPDAVQQGMHAATSMAGEPKAYGGILPIASSNFFGMTFVSCGPVTAVPQGCEMIERRGNDFYHLFITHENKLIGFLMVGKVDNLGSLRRQLLEQTQFSLL